MGSGCVVYGSMLAAGYRFRLLLVFIDVCLVWGSCQMFFYASFCLFTVFDLCMVLILFKVLLNMML